MRGVPVILLESSWFMSCCWFSRIRDQLALFLEIRISLYSLSFIWSRERLSPRDVENEKRHSSKTLLEKPNSWLSVCFSKTRSDLRSRQKIVTGILHFLWTWTLIRSNYGPDGLMIRECLKQLQNPCRLLLLWSAVSVHRLKNILGFQNRYLGTSESVTTGDKKPPQPVLCLLKE
jgi:hypothetical protein